jgi:hypothetical protein
MRPRGSTYEVILLDMIERLEDVGILLSENSHEDDRLIKTTPLWPKIQIALNVSLAALAKQSHPGAMVIEPLFERPEIDWPRFDLFVLMPFEPGLRPIYDDHIVSVAISLGLKAARADDLFTTDAVVQDVWRSINSAKVVIADCTGRNANVFYELGIAHTIGKPVILITQETDDVPFGIRHIRYIRYEYTPRGMKEFEQRLKSTLQNCYSHSTRCAGLLSGLALRGQRPSLHHAGRHTHPSEPIQPMVSAARPGGWAAGHPAARHASLLRHRRAGCRGAPQGNERTAWACHRGVHPRHLHERTAGDG